MHARRAVLSSTKPERPISYDWRSWSRQVCVFCFFVFFAPSFFHNDLFKVKERCLTVCSDVTTPWGYRPFFSSASPTKTLSIVLQKPLKHMSPHLLILANTCLARWGRGRRAEGRKSRRRSLDGLAGPTAWLRCRAPKTCHMGAIVPFFFLYHLSLSLFFYARHLCRCCLLLLGNNQMLIA